MKSYYGNFAVTLRALCYLLSLGKDGVRKAAQVAVLNANYMKKRLEPHCKMATEGLCYHEFIMTMEGYKKEHGVSALDMAKAMLDHGMHPPTMYFPLIVPEALMFEPTETESLETLDWACDTILSLLDMAKTNPEALKQAPLHTVISRPDEVTAARKPILRWTAPR